MYFFFFFQAEDGIRDVAVTGVQTCALPIYLRFAFRMLHKSPGFAAVAVVTLAVAIGANAVVFSALDAFVLRPLNVPQSESLYGLQFGGGHRGALSYPNYVDFRDRNRSFDGLATYQMTRVGLGTGNNSTRAWLYEEIGRAHV